MTRNKAIFLDRDGTINVDKDYMYKIEDFEYLPGVLEGLKALQDDGYLLIIITNQSGIARGYYSEEAYLELTEFMINDLAQKGIHITDCLYCPHHPDALIKKYQSNCECRKPKLALFNMAIEKYNIDISKSYAMGDKIRDVAICNDTDAKGFFLYTDEEKTVDNVFYITGGIYEATQMIRGENENYQK